jgi:hypothetical protein
VIEILHAAARSAADGVVVELETAFDPASFPTNARRNT